MVYLDNSATTKPCETAVKYTLEALQNNWGNPSSLYRFGLDAEMLISEAKVAVASLLGAGENEIIITSGGTEANNMAIRGIAKARFKRANRIIISAVEHHSILDTAKELSEQGFDVVVIGVDSNGRINLDELSSAVNDKTALVSVMAVNNELGTIQPLSEISRIIKAKNPSVVFHTDAVQAFGKIPLNVKALGVDLLTASSHKIHGPKGCGILYKSKNVFLPPLITGGGQEKGLRSGTEAVPAIAGFLGALIELNTFGKENQNIKNLNTYAREKLSVIQNVSVNSPENSLEYILNISVEGYRSETLLHYLETKEIYVSSGSACAKGQKSHVLKAIGLSDKLIDSALRISFSKDNTNSDIDELVNAIIEATGRLRRSQ